MPDDRAANAERARTPLLTLITQESLDEDYRHVADKRAAAGDTTSGRRPHGVATAVVLVFGLLVAIAAVQTSEASGVNDANRRSLLEQIEQDRAEAADLQRDIVHNRADVVGAQASNDAVIAAERSATNRANRLGALTGFTRVTGPGIVVTVDDAPNGEAVRDEDLQMLVNGLWEAGAEAIAINGKRLTVRSSLRNSGAAINLNGPPPLSPPYVVSAIGNARTLEADLLDTTSGLEFTHVADALGFPVTRQNEDDLTLPAAPPRQLRLRSIDTGEGQRPPGKEPPS